MLAPETRHLLTDALQPPAGCRVELAVGTTYSLDLTALLLAPMSFALHDATDARGELNDPVALLNALRRHAEHTTVFFQAGELAVPKAYRTVFAHLEDVAHAVTAPTQDRLFHPKMWLLRFRGNDGAAWHRLLCLSRNLTFDRSWDTVLQLDECLGDGANVISAEPARSFLETLPEQAVGAFPARRHDQLRDLAEGLRGVKFEVPPPFETGALLPLGLGAEHDLLAVAPNKAAVVSPFLDAGFAARMRQRAVECSWISRPETFDRLGPGTFADDELYVLQAQAESDDASGESDDEPESGLSGLHAKVLILERGDTATVITGSANATNAGWTGNVEFGVELSGPRARCGVDSLLAEESKTTGFRRLLMPYEIPTSNAEPLVEALEREIDAWLRARASEAISLHVEPAGERWDLRLELANIPALGDTRIAPVTLPFERNYRTWHPSATWHDVSLQSISPYLVVEVRLERGGAVATLRRLLIARLYGDVPDRRSKLLAEFLRSPADLIRLLMLLLGEDAARDLFGSAATGDALGFLRHGFVGDDLPVFEPLVRALARDHEALSRVSRLRSELESTPELLGLLPPGFDELWEPVRRVWEEQQDD